MNDLFSLGLSGLTAYRSALASVGENIANAETPGYARRTVRLAPAIGAAVPDPFNNDPTAFGGVRVAAVQRAWDMFQAAESRHASAGAGRTGVREQWFTAIETALDDGPAGVGAKITGFFTAADALAAMPDDRLGRSRMLMALEDVAAAFRNTADQLGRISATVTTAAQLDVDGLNGNLQALAKVNSALRVAASGGVARATLEDERDRIVDAIAGSIDIRATVGDDGAVSLDLADPPGATILGIGEAASFALTAAADGRLGLALTTNAGTTPFAPANGRIAGYIDAAATIADRRADLDALAADFAAKLNAWSAAGRDEGGAAGGPLLDASAGASSMRALETDPARVAAASAATPNGNLLALAALRGDAGAERRWTAIVAGHAQQLHSARSENAAASAWRDNSFAALDETIGIDLDREAADLLRYQQAYSAAARIVQVGKDTVNDILNLF